MPSLGRHGERLSLPPFKLYFPSSQEARNPKSGFWPVGRAMFSLKPEGENLFHAVLLVSDIANNPWLTSNFLACRRLTHVSTSVFTWHSPYLSPSLYLLLSSSKDTSQHVRLRDHHIPVQHHPNSICNNSISKQFWGEHEFGDGGPLQPRTHKNAILNELVSVNLSILNSTSCFHIRLSWQTKQS